MNNGIVIMNEKNSTKKNREVKDKRVKTKAMGGVLKVHKAEGQLHMLHLRKKSGRVWVALWTFYTKIGWRLDTIFPGRQLPRSMLQLQHKSGRKSVYVWYETRRRKSKRIVRSQAKKR